MRKKLIAIRFETDVYNKIPGKKTQFIQDAIIEKMLLTGVNLTKANCRRYITEYTDDYLQEEARMENAIRENAWINYYKSCNHAHAVRDDFMAGYDYSLSVNHNAGTSPAERERNDE